MLSEPTGQALKRIFTKTTVDATMTKTRDRIVPAILNQVTEVATESMLLAMLTTTKLATPIATSQPDRYCRSLFDRTIFMR